MKPKEVLLEFDQHLAERGLIFEAIVIGGSALALLGVITRETQDCDVLDPNIPDEIKKAAIEFALISNSKGKMLRKDWLNNGPVSLKDVLPEGWRTRLTSLFSGKAIVMHSLGRADLLRSKLFAYCDREQDYDDCISLNPSKNEILECLDWVKAQDTNPGWPAHVEKSITILLKGLGYGI